MSTKADSKQIAEFIAYILRTGEFDGWYDPDQVKPYFEAARNPNGNDELLNEMIDFLCALCNHMNEHRKDHILYNGRIPIARKLADWWDDRNGGNSPSVRLRAHETPEMKFFLKHLTIKPEHANIIKEFLEQFLKVMYEEDHTMSFQEGFETIIKLCQNITK
jgi:hypothetical protein